MNKLLLTNAATVGAVQEIGPPFTVSYNFIADQGGKLPGGVKIPFYVGGVNSYLDLYNLTNNLFYDSLIYSPTGANGISQGFYFISYKWGDLKGNVGSSVVFNNPGSPSWVDFNNFMLAGRRFKIKYINFAYNPQNLWDITQFCKNLFTFVLDPYRPTINRVNSKAFIGPYTPEGFNGGSNTLNAINAPVDVVIDKDNGFGFECISAPPGQFTKDFYSISMTLVEVK